MGRQEPNLFSQLRRGMILELESPSGSAFARIENAERNALVATLESPFPHAGRAKVRIPLGEALISATVRVTFPDVNTPNAVLLDHFAAVSTMERRSSVRLHEPVRTCVKPDSNESGYRILPALNISARGVLIGWPESPDVVLGEHVEIVVTLDNVTLPLRGEVVRVDGERTAIRFEELPERAHDAIVSYVFRREHERKLVDDPYLDVE